MFVKNGRHDQSLLPMLRRFVDNRLYRIKGFLHPIDAMIFSDLLDFQMSQGISGSVAEIGVFYGRSFALLASAIADDETALGIDLYDIDGQLEYVNRTLNDEGVLQKCTLHVGSSMDIQPSEISRQVGPVRFFSVDGGHERPFVEYDSMLALDALSSDGIIAFDDFFNSQYPDVTLAVVKFLEDHADVSPFCITKNKLYVCRRAQYETYLTFMKTAPLWAHSEREYFSFMGHAMVHPTQSVINRAIYQTLSTKGFGRLGNFLTKNQPREYTRS